MSKADYQKLEASWITREIADQAMLRRVDAQQGREIVGQKGNRDCSGILFPYYWPSDPSCVNYRLRRDHPDLVQGKNGELKEDRKYLGAPGSGNRLFIPPGVTLEQLTDVTFPIVIVEGEKKALALRRLANHESERPRFIPVAIPGVWNWLGTVGKTGGPNGERLNLTGPIPDLSRIAWPGRIVFIIFDSNIHTNNSVKAARRRLTRELATRDAKVKLVTLPEDCGVNGVDDLLAIWGPERVLELFARAVDGGQLHVVPPPQFRTESAGMFRVTQQGGQFRQTQLTNYQAVITGNVGLDDGLEVRREFEIEAHLDGRRFAFSVPASDFASMDWPINRMGPTAITFPGQREYARTAIQSFSFGVQERTIYTHTGWHKIGNQWVYLHAGGGLGPTGPVPGVEVRLGGVLSHYGLLLPKAPDVAAAVRASLRLAALGPPAICFALLAATYRAALGESDFALHLAGPTGVFKSEIAALFQQHFGAGMNARNLPASWSSTANALEAMAFYAKDALLVIDDFAPQGTSNEISRYHAAADRVFRAAGNRSGRSRLDATARLRESKPPRGLILSTGEDIPRGHSVRARLLVLELSHGSISTGDLTDSQRLARDGLYAQAMGGFIQWMAGDFEEKRVAFGGSVAERRLRAMQNATHARTPDIVANLQTAFELFLEFAEMCGVVGRGERERLASDCWTALREAADAQARHHVAAEPTKRFLELLSGCLSSGSAHLRSRDGVVPDRSPLACGWRLKGDAVVPLGDCIGWVLDDAIYLEPSSAYRVVQIAARDMGDPLALSEHVIRKRLHEKGLLASTDEKRETLTVRRSIGGSSKNVLHFLRSTILPEVSEVDPEDIGG